MLVPHAFSQVLLNITGQVAIMETIIKHFSKTRTYSYVYNIFVGCNR